MYKLLRVFTAPEHVVHSLAVQAQMGTPAVKRQSQFEILVRHFLDSLFNNEMVSSDGEAKTHLIQALYAIALPGVLASIFLFPPYHAPMGRHYWSQVGDHSYFVIYSMVAVGVLTVFEWDLFFPSAVDIFVLSSLPIDMRKLFRARITAVGIFLGLLITGANLLGTLFFPASADLPSFLRHLTAHFLAVTASGVFAAAFVLAIQGSLLALLGQRVFDMVSPLLQAGLITVLLTMLFLCPVFSHVLEAMVESHGPAIWFFPPLWFLGLYERLLTGRGGVPAFGNLALMGLLATGGTLVVACVAYPLAYQRRSRQLIEGRPRSDTRSWLETALNGLLHATMARKPLDRAIFHFIGQTLSRTHRHRVYLAMYGGAGAAVIFSSVILLRVDKLSVAFSLSAAGLRAAVPMVAFWSIAGLRNAFASPVDQRGSWVFRLVLGRPEIRQLSAARRWILFWGGAVTLAMVGAIHAIAPPELRDAHSAALQVMMAVALCVLLRDILLARAKSIPFTQSRSAGKSNLALVLIEYFGLFPPLVLVTLGVESWMQQSRTRILEAAVVAGAAHLVMIYRYRKMMNDHGSLVDVDEEEEEFPQRLGLRY